MLGMHSFCLCIFRMNRIIEDLSLIPMPGFKLYLVSCVDIMLPLYIRKPNGPSRAPSINAWRLHSMIILGPRNSLCPPYATESRHCSINCAVQLGRV